MSFLIYEEEISTYEAAERTGLTVEEIGAIIAGTLSVTPEIASKLGKLSGTTAELWLNAQQRFDTDQA